MQQPIQDGETSSPPGGRTGTPTVPRIEPAPGPESAAVQAEREPNPVIRLFRILGPGLVTGASDDDPSGIGTYAVAGAAFGFGLLWTALVTFPLMAAVQFICATVGL